MHKHLTITVTVDGKTVTARIPAKGESLRELVEAFGDTECAKIVVAGLRQVYQVRAKRLLARGWDSSKIAAHLEGEWKPGKQRTTRVDRIARQVSALSKEERDALAARIGGAA